jgi:hypothetical protein
MPAVSPQPTGALCSTRHHSMSMPDRGGGFFFRRGVYRTAVHHCGDEREAYRSSILSLLWYHIALSALIFKALVPQDVVFEYTRSVTFSPPQSRPVLFVFLGEGFWGERHHSLRLEKKRDVRGPQTLRCWGAGGLMPEGRGARGARANPPPAVRPRATRVPGAPTAGPTTGASSYGSARHR